MEIFMIVSITKLDIGYVILWSNGLVEYITSYELEQRNKEAKEAA